MNLLLRAPTPLCLLHKILHVLAIFDHSIQQVACIKCFARACDDEQTIIVNIFPSEDIALTMHQETSQT